MGRADLLEALQRGPLSWFALPDPDAGAQQGDAGFRYQPLAPPPELPSLPRLDPGGREPTVAAPPTPLRMPEVWAVVSVEGEPGATPDAQQEAGLVPGDVQLVPRPDATSADMAGRRLMADAADAGWPGLRMALRDLFNANQPTSNRRAVDWRLATHRIAQGRPLAPLPTRQQARWPANLVLALDREASSMNPLVPDMDALVPRLRRTLGVRAVQVRVLAADPGARSTPWFRDLPPASAAPAPAGQAWRPLFGGWLLVVSDLGQTGGASERASQFSQWLRFMAHGGTRVAALQPLPGPTQPSAGMGVHALTWGPGAGPQIAGTSGQPTALQALLALVGLVGRVSDTLLRALAQLVGPNVSARALVWSAWNHPDMLAVGRMCRLRDESSTAHERLLPKLPAQWLMAAHHWRWLMQAPLPAADEHLAVLRAHALASSMHAALATARRSALHYLRETLPGSLALAAPADQGAMLRQAAMVVALAHPQVQASYAQDFRRLQSLAFNDAVRRGESVPTFAALGPVLPASPIGAEGPQSGPVWRLVQHGQRLRLSMPTPREPHVVLHERLGPAPLHHGVTLAQGEQSRWLPITLPVTDLVDLNSAESPLQIRLGALRIRLERLARPTWAQAWQRSAQGLSVGFSTPWGSAEWLPWPMTAGSSLQATPSRPGRRLWFATDAAGLFLDLQMGAVIQRLRYLPPGHFLMGSPAAEKGRDSDEGPQHPVTLTQGFWLADSPCTQALWQAVMGDKENPSHFKDGPGAADRPVDSVSWLDASRFLQRLQAVLPAGCEAVLPTEAEWEYAARAGSRTAYAWGDAAHANRANMDRKQNSTSRVGHYPANDWGLYDMHGNVWEWCADGSKRLYMDRPEVDPKGDAKGDTRVQRGGSWYYPAGFARSACRDDFHRGLHWRGTGFRFALRSPSPGGPGVGLAAGQAPAAGGSPRTAEPGAVAAKPDSSSNQRRS